MGTATSINLLILADHTTSSGKHRRQQWHTHTTVGRRGSWRLMTFYAILLKLAVKPERSLEKEQFLGALPLAPKRLRHLLTATANAISYFISPLLYSLVTAISLPLLFYLLFFFIPNFYPSPLCFPPSLKFPTPAFLSVPSLSPSSHPGSLPSLTIESAL